jgi:hypothetical protein
MRGVWTAALKVIWGVQIAAIKRGVQSRQSFYVGSPECRYNKSEGSLDYCYYFIYAMTQSFLKVANKSA